MSKTKYVPPYPSSIAKYIQKKKPSWYVPVPDEAFFPPPAEKKEVPFPGIHPHPEPFCAPTQPCSRTLPDPESGFEGVTVVEGNECPNREQIAYHNTNILNAIHIVDEGLKVNVSERGPTAKYSQDKALSLSACHGNTYGGNIKLVLDIKGLNTRPMCYVDEKYRNKVDEIASTVNSRAKLAVSPSMYLQECEIISYEDIPPDRIKKMEYWIPWNISSSYSNVGCINALPKYSSSEAWNSEENLEDLQAVIKEARELAQSKKIPFEVKSCFSAFKLGIGKKHVPLDENNLDRLTRGLEPHIESEQSPPELCRCQKT